MSKLRLEYVEAGTLADNPLNWRKHSQEQLQTLRDLLTDEKVGWAGVCLYNERTKRLVDGHARKSVSDPKEKIPVLIGDWSEEDEAKILATLDPIAGMATTDAQAYAKLLETVNADSALIENLVNATLKAADAMPDEKEKPDAADGPSLPLMECQPFEHYDYIVVVSNNIQDWNFLCERLGIAKVDCTVMPNAKTRKIGLGRAVWADKLVKLIGGESNA